MIGRGISDKYSCFSIGFCRVFIDDSSPLINDFDGLIKISRVNMMQVVVIRFQDIWPRILVDGFVWEVCILEEMSYRANAEAVNSLIKPEYENVGNVCDYCRVTEIEVWLASVELVQIILLSLLVPRPCGTAKCAKPVVWRVDGAVCSDPISPHVIVGVGFDTCDRILEPNVFVAGMIRNKVQNHLQICK